MKGMRSLINKSRFGLKKINLLTFSFLFFGVTVFAQETEVEKLNAATEDLFYEGDTDNDDLWSVDEFGAATEEGNFYNGLDSDNDGMFSEEEWNKGLFGLYDEDEDNSLAREEFDAYNEEWGFENDFSEWDTNNDNILDDDEFRIGVNGTAYIDDWDLDKDGLFSRDEINKGLFQGQDKNKDNYLEYGEYNAEIFNNWP